MSLDNESGAIAKFIGANKAAEITHHRTRQARLHQVHHLSVFMCQVLQFLHSFLCLVKYASPSNISFSWMLVNNGTNPFTQAACVGWRGKSMVISHRRKLKGGSSADIQIADRGFFHHLTNVPYAWHWEMDLESCIIWWYLPLLPSDKQNLFTAHL